MDRNRGRSGDTEIMEKGLFRKDEEQIAQDTNNQEDARQRLADLLGMEIVNMDSFSIWDWEFRKEKLIAIGEYRRRFNDFDKYPDFQFSKYKFDTMRGKCAFQNILAFMFVEFDDGFFYFAIEGYPPTEIMQRNGEMRTEEVVVIPKESFKPIEGLTNEF
jgi:hypothetical protein